MGFIQSNWSRLAERCLAQSGAITVGPEPPPHRALAILRLEEAQAQTLASDPTSDNSKMAQG